MKVKILITLSLICFAFFVMPVLSDELQTVSITYGGDQFVSVPTNTNVTYLYTSSVPSNGILLLSLPDNDTYMVKSDTAIEMVTVNKSNLKNIIDTILGWVGL
jgi:hypothetical protein